MQVRTEAVTDAVFALSLRCVQSPHRGGPIAQRASRASILLAAGDAESRSSSASLGGLIWELSGSIPGADDSSFHTPPEPRKLFQRLLDPNR